MLIQDQSIALGEKEKQERIKVMMKNRGGQEVSSRTAVITKKQ